MQFLIVGLGNIGEEYQETRHNVGFMVVDALSQQLSTHFQTDKNAYSAHATYKGRKLILLKPTTYMNLSGKAVLYHLLQNKIPIENLLVITDDIALPFGTLRLKPKGSDGGHNGLKNIQDLLQSTNYPRLRVGIGSEFSKGKQTDYVLGKFRPEEQEILPRIIEAGTQAVLSFVFHGINATMNQFNKSFL
ncbi:MAG: peptidyl-tRNA hydrolase [Bacteroidia bacterium]|nr:MAG: peptidyl-tRNA hydrolase [Bacteroidia bacterium]